MKAKSAVSHLSVIARLQQRITAELAPYTTDLSNFALLDFPNYSNVGDSAIWLGETAYFKSLLKVRPAYVCTIETFNARELRQAVPRGPIFLSGGGNFGDLWPAFQVFREDVLSQFADRLVVQLPQSVHFDDYNVLRRAAAAIKAHGNFVLCVRDRRALEISKSAFDCPVHLVPDMAFCIGPQALPVPPRHRSLFLLRTDKESIRLNTAAHDLSLPEDAMAMDWLDEEPGLYGKLKASLGEDEPHDALFVKLAANRFMRGARLLSSASFVVTDRLHGHIMCVLLGIPHVALDNSYGKVSSFIDTWTKDCDVLQTAPSLDVAIRMVTGRQSEAQTR